MKGKLSHETDAVNRSKEELLSTTIYSFLELVTLWASRLFIIIYSLNG